MKRKSFLSLILFVLIYILIKKYMELLDENCVLKEKTDRQIITMKKWIRTENVSSKIENYLYDLNIFRIAIYGMGFMGNRLYNIFESSKNIEVVYGIDKNAGNIKSDLKIFSLEENLDKNVDAIIVSNFYDCGMIYKELKKIYTETRIIFLEEILDNVQGKIGGVTI